MDIFRWPNDVCRCFQLHLSFGCYNELTIQIYTISVTDKICNSLETDIKEVSFKFGK